MVGQPGQGSAGVMGNVLPLATLAAGLIRPRAGQTFAQTAYLMDLFGRRQREAEQEKSKQQAMLQLPSILGGMPGEVTLQPGRQEPTQVFRSPLPGGQPPPSPSPAPPPKLFGHMTREDVIGRAQREAEQFGAPVAANTQEVTRRLGEVVPPPPAQAGLFRRPDGSVSSRMMSTLQDERLGPHEVEIPLIVPGNERLAVEGSAGFTDDRGRPIGGRSPGRRPTSEEYERAVQWAVTHPEVIRMPGASGALPDVGEALVREFGMMGQPEQATVETRPPKTRQFERPPTMAEALGRARDLPQLDDATRARLMEMVARSSLPSEAKIPEAAKQDQQIETTIQGLMAQRPDMTEDQARSIAAQHVRGAQVPSTAMPPTGKARLEETLAQATQQFIAQAPQMDFSTPQGLKAAAAQARQSGLFQIATGLEGAVPSPFKPNVNTVTDTQGQVHIVVTPFDAAGNPLPPIVQAVTGVTARTPEGPAAHQILQSLGLVIAGQPNRALPEHQHLTPQDARVIADTMKGVLQQVSPSLAAGVILTRLEEQSELLRRAQAKASAAKSEQERMRAETEADQLMIRINELNRMLSRFQTPGPLGAPPPPGPAGGEDILQNLRNQGVLAPR